MSIACCDPKKEPQLVDPNEWSIDAQEWTRIAVSVPSLITPQEQPLGRIIGFPRRFPPRNATGSRTIFTRGRDQPPITFGWGIFYILRCNRPSTPSIDHL